MADEKKKKKGFWKTMRWLFRWCRIAVLLFLFLFVFAAIYFNTIGLPNFVKRPLLSRLREHGWEVQFSEMRWHWYRGVVILDGSFSKTNEPVKFTAKETDLNVNLSELHRSKLKLQDLTIEKGDLSYLVSSNQPPLVLKDIKTKFHFRGPNQLRMDPFEATLGKARIKISGALTNFADLVQLKTSTQPTNRITTPSTSKTNIVWKTKRLTPEEILKFLDRFQFAGTPEIELKIQGDAQDWNSANGTLKVTAPAAETPWGLFKGLRLNGDLRTGKASEFHLVATEAKTPWGNGKTLNAKVSVAPNATNKNLLQTELRLSANQLEAENFLIEDVATNLTNPKLSVKAVTVQIHGRATHSLGKVLPQKADGKLRLLKSDLHFTPGEIGVPSSGSGAPQPSKGEIPNHFSALLNEGEINFAFDKNATNKLSSDSGYWKNWEPFTFDWKLDLLNIQGPKLNVEKFFSIGEWNASELKFTQTAAQLYGGHGNASATLDIGTRHFSSLFSATNVNIHQVAPLLPRASQRFISNFGWKVPPSGYAQISLTLPKWNDPKPDWQKEVLPTFIMDAFVHTTNAVSYQTIQFTRGSSSAHYSNRVWRLPDIKVGFPNGQLELAHISDEGNHDFHWRIDGIVDPQVARLELEEEHRPWLDIAQFPEPPEVHAVIAGNWRRLHEIDITASMAATNFTFRNERIDRLSTSFHFTNEMATFTNAHLTRDKGQAEVPEVMVDFHSGKVFFHNIQSSVDPMFVARCVGQNVIDAIAPYHFPEPPNVRMNGTLHYKNLENTDLQFDISGGKFDWGIFHADTAGGQLDWRGSTLALTNCFATAYKTGKLSGNGFLDFLPGGRADYRFEARWENVDAQALTKSLEKTNSIEGLIDGQLNITSANTDGLHTWQGIGGIKLREGLIWEIKVFGIFSPILDAIVPGMGKNRAKEASANFVISNGVAQTEDLEIRASTLRIQYRGSVDYQWQVDARVEAEILRDAFAIGKIVSLALAPVSKLFEYKVSGTLDNPKMEPVYIPKFLLMTLRPFHTLKGLLPEKEK